MSLCNVHNRPGRAVTARMVVCDWCDAGHPTEGPAIVAAPGDTEEWFRLRIDIDNASSTCIYPTDFLDFLDDPTEDINPGDWLWGTDQGDA